jgi:hypothetical protein
MRRRDIFFFDACNKFFVLPAEVGEGGAKIRQEIEFQISVLSRVPGFYHHGGLSTSHSAKSFKSGQINKKTHPMDLFFIFAN